MARIQILELPTFYREDGGRETPFVLIVDQYQPTRHILGPDQEPPVSQWDGVAEQIGARHILVFEETVEIPSHTLPLLDASRDRPANVLITPGQMVDHAETIRTWLRANDIEPEDVPRDRPITIRYSAPESRPTIHHFVFKRDDDGHLMTEGNDVVRLPRVAPCIVPPPGLAGGAVSG